MSKHEFALAITPNDMERPEVYDHEFVTIEDISKAITEENIERFLKHFGNGLRVYLSMRKAIKPEDAPLEALSLRSFKWTDTGK